MRASKIFCFRKKEFVTNVTCFLANEYWDNLNAHLLLRNILYKWIHNLSAVPELSRVATVLFQLKPLYNIAPFWQNLPFQVSCCSRHVAFHLPYAHLTQHLRLGQSSYTVFHTHTAFSFGGRCSSVRPGRFGVRNTTGPTFAAPVQTSPEAQPAPVQWVQWVSFLRLKRPGRGIDHPPPSSAVATERVQL